MLCCFGMENLSFYDVFLRGGVVMWPLLLCSVLGAAVILERGFFFLRMGMDTRRFEDGVAAKLRRGDMAGALAMSLASPHPVARVAAGLLRKKNFMYSYLVRLVTIIKTVLMVM